MIIWIFLTFIAVRLFGLNQSFWLDEAAQVIESGRPLSSQLDIRGDFWPPLYHVLLHMWMYFGTSEVWIRLLSVVFAGVTFIFVYKLALELSSKKAAILTVLMFAIAPFHVWYSQEARPYALATLLGVATTYFLVKLKWRSYLLATVIFLYSSYLAIFLLISQGIFLWVYQKKQFSLWLKQIGISVLFFLPWIPALYEQLGIGRGLTQSLPGWSEAVSTPLLKSLPLIFTKFMIGRVTFDDKFFYIGLIVGLAGLFSFLTYKAYNNDKTVIYKLGILGGLPILMAYMVSLILPILAPQRVLYVLPMMYLLIALGSITLKKYFWIPLAIVLFVSLHSLYLYNVDPRFQREQWRQAVSYVEETRSPKSIAVFVFPEAFAPWQWYSKDVVTSLGIAAQLVFSEKDMDKNHAQLLSADKLYYFHYLTDLTDPQKKAPAYLESIGFFETDKKDFSGVGFITTYEKALATR